MSEQFSTTTAKPWWQSKTVWGGVIAAGASVAGVFGYTVDQATALELSSSVVGLFGAGLAVYGRFAASKPVVVKKS